MTRKSKPDGTGMSAFDVADKLGVSPNKVHSWIHSGELRAIDTASQYNDRPRYRILKEDFEAFVASRVVRPVGRKTKK